MRITSRVAFSFLLVLSGAPLWVACANSDGAGDLTTPDGGEGASAATGPRATGATSGASGTSDAGGGDAGSSMGDAHADASAVAEGGSGPVVRCGFSATCPLPDQICCVAGAAYACMTATTCPNVAPSSPAPGSAALACSGTESCGAGLSCCLDVVAGQSVSSCQSSCAAAHAQLCAPFTADPGCPGGGLTCSQSHINEFGLSVAYGTCGGVKN